MGGADRGGDGSALGAGRLSGGYARLVVRLLWLVIAGWVAVAVGLSLLGPGSAGSGADLGGFVSVDNPAIATEIRSFQAFGFPLSSRTVLVQRDPDGLSVYAQAEAVLRAAAVDQQAYDAGPIRGALPVPNALFPGAAERGTAVLTYLFLPPAAGFADQRQAAQDFARRHLDDPDDAYVGVTGSVPARAEQAALIERSLPRVEAVTVAVIALIVAVSFRSLVAPLVALFVAGIATVSTLHVAALLAGLLGISVPADIEPLIVALLLGVVTDYSVFFLAGLRGELAAAAPDREAVLRATARTAPIVAVAGLTVAAGTAALLVARSALFRGLGPGLALTVLIGLVVAVTLVPAVLAVLGPSALWPSGPRGAPAPASAAPASVVPAARPDLATALTRPRTAAVVTALAVAGLLLAASPLRHLQLGVSFIGSLPADSSVAQAAQQARVGFAPGVLAPTEVLLEGQGVARQPEAVARLGALLQTRPGVNTVVGPGRLPVADRYGVFLARSGDAARLLVVLDERPLSAPAIDTVRALQDALPALLEQAGLSGASASLAGDTALSASIVQDTTRDLLRISVAALLANLVMLVLFLRAVVTSLLLLASSVLALAVGSGHAPRRRQPTAHPAGPGGGCPGPLPAGGGPGRRRLPDPGRRRHGSPGAGRPASAGARRPGAAGTGTHAGPGGGVPGTGSRRAGRADTRRGRLTAPGLRWHPAVRRLSRSSSAEVPLLPRTSPGDAPLGVLGADCRSPCRHPPPPRAPRTPGPALARGRRVRWSHQRIDATGRAL